MKHPKIKKNSPKYSEDLINVKQIVNGMIHLESGEYVTGVKISPKNIFIMDQQEKESVIYNLRNFYNLIDYEFWIIIADRPVDINVYLSQLQLLYRHTNDAKIRKLIMQDLNKANSFMSAEYNVVDIEYYIIFKERKMEIVQKKLHNLISGLANCGLNSTQTSNSDLRMLLDNFLNGGEQSNFGVVMS